MIIIKLVKWGSERYVFPYNTKVYTQNPQKEMADTAVKYTPTQTNLEIIFKIFLYPGFGQVWGYSGPLTLKKIKEIKNPPRWWNNAGQ